MAKSKLKEIKTLRKTLMKWRNEILNYFKTGITNARTEGFNNVAKVLKRNGVLPGLRGNAINQKWQTQTNLNR